MGNSSKSKLVRQEKEVDFKSGFNNFEFTDRTLRLEIEPLAAAENNDVKVLTFRINSYLFSAKSPFFSKLFNNGMEVSKDKETFSLRISESEEAGFMDLLNSMHRKPLQAGGSWCELVDVLTVADKFVVASCITDCMELLLQLPMTMDRALFCMDLPYMAFDGLGFEPLKEQVNKYLGTQFREFTESKQEEAMAFPLWAIEGILGSKDSLQVTSEDTVFQFILKWARQNYPKLEERQAVVRSLSARFVFLWRMGTEELKGVMDCPELRGNSEEMFKQLIQSLVISQGNEAEAGCSRRVYERPLVKVVQLNNYSLPRCIVFLDLHKQQCLDTFSAGKQVSSTPFRLGGRSFLIEADRVGPNSSFGLYLVLEQGSQSCTLDAEFSAITNSSNREFIRLIKFNSSLPPGAGVGHSFLTPWTKVLTDYFIHGILHFRLDITIVT